MAGSTAAGIRSFFSRSWSHSMLVGSTSCGHGGVRGVSVTCRASEPGAPSTQRPGDPTCRRCRRTVRPARLVRPVRVDLVEDRHHLAADVLGARRMPSAWSARQVPTVRRSCQPIPGATGRPARGASHTITDACWLAMPTPSIGPPAASAAAATSNAASAIRAASTRTRPGAGASRAGGGHGARGPRSRRGVRSPPAHPTCRRRRRGRCRSLAHAHGAGPNGESRPNLPGLRMPLGSNVCFSPRRTSNPEPSARGRNRLRLRPIPW